MAHWRNEEARALALGWNPGQRSDGAHCAGSSLGFLLWDALELLCDPGAVISLWPSAGLIIGGAQLVRATLPWLLAHTQHRPTRYGPTLTGNSGPRAPHGTDAGCLWPALQIV